MVKKSKWLKKVKKALRSDSKKLKHYSVERENSVISYPVLVATSRSSPPQFEVRVDKINNEQKKYLCPPPSNEDHVLVDSPPSAPPEIVPRITSNRFPEKSKEESAAIIIQTMTRGYLAIREVRVIRRLARLKLLMEGVVVQRQTANTLKCMQTFTRVQSQILTRRIRMSEENQAHHKQLIQKHAKELRGLKNGSNWKDSNQSKENAEAKYEATMRRERALAYAFTHRQKLKNNSKSANYMFMDPSNPTWGWSWFERWMANRPWETSEKKLVSSNNNDKSSSAKTSSSRGETSKSINHNKLNGTTQTTNQSSMNPRKKKPIPPSIKSKTIDENTKSSENNRKHKSARSSCSDEESLANSTVQTKPARSKLKAQSSSGTTTTTKEVKGNVLPEKAPPKKRPISSSASPAPKPRRSSAPPPKVETGVNKVRKTP